MGYYGIEYLNLNPNGIFHTAVFVHFCEAFLGIKPHWILLQKFFRVKPQPSASNPQVVRGAGIQMREDAAEQYLSYKLIDSNQDWKAKWFYITNHHPGLPKPSGKQPKHRPWWNTEPTMQEGIQLPELLARIKALREAGLREAQGAATDGSRHPGVRCLETKPMTTTLSIGWCGSSRTCRRTRRAPYRSTPPRARQRR
jgi:hypothetical protein